MLFKGPKDALLNHILRSDMKYLVVKLKNVMKSVTAQFEQQNLRYVAINEEFQGPKRLQQGLGLTKRQISSPSTPFLTRSIYSRTAIGMS